MATSAHSVAVPDQRAMWESWHSRHVAEGSWTEADGPLVAQFLANLPIGALPILDLGCGQATSALYDPSNSARVSTILGVDFSARAIALARARTHDRREGTSFRCADITEPLDISSQTLGGVYAHLSLHYFDPATTANIVSEIRRVLVSRGIFAVAVKSVHDKLYGLGAEVAPDCFVRKSHVRRFFTDSALLDLLQAWDVLEFCEVKAFDPDAEAPSAILMAVARRP